MKKNGVLLHVAMCVPMHLFVHHLACDLVFIIFASRMDKKQMGESIISDFLKEFCIFVMVKKISNYQNLAWG